MLNKEIIIAGIGSNIHIQAETPIEFFNSLFSIHARDLIFEQTTLYSQQWLRKNQSFLSSHPHARAHDIQNIQRNEMYALIAIIITLGVVGFPSVRYGALKDYT